MESKQEGRLPFFREKPHILAMQEGKDLELSCFAVGDPDPVVQWFKYDLLKVILSNLLFLARFYWSLNFFIIIFLIIISVLYNFNFMSFLFYIFLSIIFIEILI